MHYAWDDTAVVSLLLVAMLAAAGCSSETPTPPPEPPPTGEGEAGVPTQISFETVEGAPAESGPGGPFEDNVPVQPGFRYLVRAVPLDQQGRPVPNLTLNWAVAGGGSLDHAVSAPSGGNDPTLNAWTVGATEGVQSITVTLPTHPSVEGVLHVRAANLRIVPVSPADTSGVTLKYGEQIPVTAQLLTAAGEPFQWFITFTAFSTQQTPCAALDNSGFAPAVNGTPRPVVTVPTDAQGRATVTYTATTRRYYSYCNGGVRTSAAVSPGGIDGLSKQLNWQVAFVPLPPSQVLVTSGSGQAASPGATLGQDLVAQVTDVFGNGVAGVPVTWTTSSGSLSASTTTTVIGGMASVKWTVGTTPGTFTVTASIAGGARADFTVTVS